MNKAQMDYSYQGYDHKNIDLSLSNDISQA